MLPKVVDDLQITCADALRSGSVNEPIVAEMRRGSKFNFLVNEKSKAHKPIYTPQTILS